MFFESFLESFESFLGFSKLSIFIEHASPTYGEEIGNNITLFRSEKTDEVVGIGVLNFKKRTKSLQEIKLNLPFNVNFSALNI